MFGRRSQDEQSGTRTATAEPVPRDPQAPKGRPTPKRREAQSQRRTAVTRPASRKEAGKRVREVRRQEMVKQREALAGGDERYLPARDKGPVRRAVRDWVDSRWHVGELFLPLAIPILILSMVPNLRIKDLTLVLWLLLLVGIIGQSVVNAVRLRTELRRRFPSEALGGSMFYGIMRTLQMRRMRLPKPQVKRGGGKA